MLQPAATSASSALSLKPGTQGGKAEKSDIPEGFAALLESGKPESAEGEAKPEALTEAAGDALRQTGAASGKQAGNILPVVLPDGTKIGTETDTDDKAAADESAKTGPAATDPMVSILALTQSVPALSVAAPAIKKGTAASGGKAASPPLAQAAAQKLSAEGAKAAQTPSGPQADKLSTSTAPQQALGEQASAKLSVELPGKKEAGATAKTASPLATSEALTNANRPATADSSAQPDAGTGDSAHSRQPAAEPRTTGDKTDRHALATASQFTAAADATANNVQPTAAELQPVMAMRDAQSATSNGAGATSAVGSASSVQHGGHDFSTLVDRLVEARDAAMPQTVRAAIHHTEFGQVSLNFQADDARLSVSMTSADPDFAPAVQAAAAMHSQTQTSADNGSNGNQRQDSQQSQQQNSANSASTGQSQSQGSPRGGEGSRADLSRQAGNGQSTAAREEEQRQTQGSGIYA